MRAHLEYEITAVYNRLNKVQRQHRSGGGLHSRDTDWLIYQAETLALIANRWAQIEKAGDKERAHDFYSFVQDILSNTAPG